MKRYANILIAAACALLTPLQADIITVLVSPTGTNQGGSGNPEPLYGTLNGGAIQNGISNQPGVLGDGGGSDVTPSGDSFVYAVNFTGVPTWNTISFDLTVTASTTDPSGAGLLYNGGPSQFWTVDTGDDSNWGTATSETGDESRIRSGEFVSFSVSNLSSPGNAVTFQGFTALNISQAGSFDTGTGIFTGADGSGTGGRINAVQFQLDIQAIPEPGTLGLFGAGLGLLLAVGRRIRG